MPLRQDPLLERLAPLRKLGRSTMAGYAVAIAAVGLALFLCLLLSKENNVAPFITFYPAIVLAALVGRFRAGLLAVVLSALAADYFFVRPALPSPLVELVSVGLFVLIGTLIAGVIGLLFEVLKRVWRLSDNLQLILETAPAGIIAVDDAGHITLANAAIEKLFGYRRDELLGGGVEQLLPPEMRAAHAGFREDYLRQPEVRAMGAGRDLEGQCRDGSRVPVEIGLNPIERDGRKGALAIVLDVSVRKSLERKQRILMHEVQHRARNLLSLAQVIALRTFVPDRPLEDSRKAFAATLQALARTQDLLQESQASLRRIAEAELAPFRGQVTIEGPDMPLLASAAQNFGLILHELATNALKYGALSSPDGRIAIRWKEEGDMLAFAWTESNGPPVAAPLRKGFGQVILRDLAGEFSTSLKLDYAPDGFRYDLQARLAAIAEQDRKFEPEMAAGQRATRN